MMTVWLCLSICLAFSQNQTVGLTIKEDGAMAEGYTFFMPQSSNKSYLVDECGYVVNEWDGHNRPGLGGYLLPNGLVLRTNKVDNPFFFQASTGGVVELINWENEVVWSYEMNNQERIQHHDVAYMPNGNILIPGWERISVDEQIALGKNPNSVTFPDLWGEFIYEVKPIGSNQAEIVWEWHLKDHFIQEFSSSAPNYANIAENIGKVNINYQGPSAWDDDDWWHCNAIDYNAELDQIILNSRNNNEMWILDHSTTTAQAATDSGGRSGKGGDLIYRWGNPRAYNRGSTNDLRMFGSHGNYWIPAGLPNAGKILYFNNGDDRPQGYYSTIEMLDLSPDANGNYPLSSSGRYLPEESELAYGADMPFEFISRYLSNAQQLPNGNIFINEGGQGRLFEVNTNGDILWQYISPVTFFGNIEQGQPASSHNDIFRAYRFPKDYPAFDGKDLTPKYLLEGDDNPLCNSVSTADYSFDKITTIYHPAQGKLEIQADANTYYQLHLHGMDGRLVKSAQLSGLTSLDVSHLNKGIYILQLIDSEKRINTQKLAIY